MSQIVQTRIALAHVPVLEGQSPAIYVARRDDSARIDGLVFVLHSFPRDDLELS